MNAQPVSKRFTIILMLAAAAGLGGCQRIALSPTASADKQAAFVQSGVVATDVDPSVPDAAQALSHARAPNDPEVVVSTF